MAGSGLGREFRALKPPPGPKKTSEGEAGVSSSSERQREWEASTSSDMSSSTLVLRDWAAGKSKESRLSLAHFLSHPLIHSFTRAFSRHRAKCTEGRCAQGDRLHSEPHSYLEPASPSCPVSSSPIAEPHLSSSGATKGRARSW